MIQEGSSSGHDLGPFEDADLVRRLVDDGMVLFLALDGSGDISWIGRSCQQILGLTPDQLIGRPGLDLVHPEDQAVVMDTLAEPARNADERILAVLRVAHSDGSWITLEFGGLDLRSAAGEGMFLVWGRSYESAGRLVGFLETLLAGEPLAELISQVLGWCDSLAPYCRTVVLELSDGAYRAIASADLHWSLGPGLVLEPGTPGPWEDAMQSGQPAEANVADLPDWLTDHAIHAGLDAVWAAPIDWKAPGRARGLLVSWRQRPGRLLATHIQHLKTAARFSQLAIEWANERDTLLTAATTDSLTGVANRIMLRTQVATDRSELAAMLFCDLDYFKALNDQYGHTVGDQVLREAARRMQSAIRGADLLVRLGGDEFAVWCPGLACPEDAIAIAQRIIDEIRRPMIIDDTEHQLGCSIGIALTPNPDGTADAGAVLRTADRQLYRAKHAGRGGWVLD